MTNLVSILTFNLKAVLIFVLIFIFCSSVYSQDKKEIDSLELVYTSGNFKEQDRIKILQSLASEHLNPAKQLEYSKELIKLSQKLDSVNYLFSGYMSQGTALRLKGNYSKALESILQAVQIATDKKSNKKQGRAYITIANIYSEMGNHDNSIVYYQKGIDILRKTNDSLIIAKALYNAGDEFVNMEKYETAKKYFKESGLIFKRVNFLQGTAYNLGNIGKINTEQGNYNLAKQNINQAIAILEKIQDYPPISEFLIYMSDIYANQNDFKSASSYAHRSLKLSQKYGLKKEIGDANLKLSELYNQTGDQVTSYKYYKDYIIYRDSVNNIETVQQMADMRTDFEIQKREDEILVFKKEAVITELKAKRQRIVNYASASATVLILLLAFSYYRRYRFSKKANLVIEEEKNRSQKLLLNILPKKTAIELIHNGKVEAKKFNSVSVMFTDFKDFTQHSHNLSPEELVNSVDFYYSKFDEIIEKYDLEKIKTIGDSYMCAGGLPFPTIDHADKIIQAAIEIEEFMEKSRNMKDKNISYFDIRIGINSGPVVAGVVGTIKFAYDIWGDTVNVASRMEGMSVPGRINISESTYKLVKYKFDCEYRGEFEVKNKGLMKMYFVNTIKNKKNQDLKKEEIES